MWKNVEIQDRDKKRNIKKSRVKVVRNRETERKIPRKIINRKNQTKIRMEF